MRTGSLSSRVPISSCSVAVKSELQGGAKEAVPLPGAVAVETAHLHCKAHLSELARRKQKQ